MADQRTYPHGVPSWVETEQPDPDAARLFYGELFGWTFETVSPPGVPEYVIARVDGRDAAGLGGLTGGATRAGWHTYIAVDDADATVGAVQRAGGTVIVAPADAGPAGRAATCADPAGARFRLWQAGRRAGAQVVNVPGGWNFSNLLTADAAAATAFYGTVFGWEFEDIGFGTMIRVPGYGDHLESTVDPDIRTRQDSAHTPSGFADAVGWLVPGKTDTPPAWTVTISIADRDAAVETVRKHGGEVLSTEESEWSRTALVRDPAGAEFTASQFTPPG